MRAHCRVDCSELIIVNELRTHSLTHFHKDLWKNYQSLFQGGRKKRPSLSTDPFMLLLPTWRSMSVHRHTADDQDHPEAAQCPPVRPIIMKGGPAAAHGWRSRPICEFLQIPRASSGALCKIGPPASETGGRDWY